MLGLGLDILTFSFSAQLMLAVPKQCPQAAEPGLAPESRSRASGSRERGPAL